MKKAVVIGAGTMGRGIAQYLASQGLSVQMVDLDQTFLQKALNSNFESWDKLELKGKFTSTQVKEFKNALSISSLEGIDCKADIIIEAIIEDLEAKKKLFQDLDQKMKKETLFASNTSSIPIATLGASLCSERRSRLLGLHFFNPAPVMKLVELISSPFTDEKYIHYLEKWFEEHGKKPVRSSDSPGFIVNRVARNFYGEPLRILECHQVEKAREIDSVMKQVGGFRMGPFELMDHIGIDINYAVTQSVWKAYYHEPRFAPHRLQRMWVEANMLGKKTGRGVYDYE